MNTDTFIPEPHDTRNLPRTDSLAHRVLVELAKAHAFCVEHEEEDPWLTAAALAAELGVADPSNVCKMLRRLKADGWAECSYQGRAMSARFVPADATVAEAGFICALHSDGELTMNGVRQTTDGGVVLSRYQAQALREYLLHVGSWLEELSQQQAQPAAESADLVGGGIGHD